VTDWQGRISFDPSVCLKAPCTKGTGIHVWGILSCLSMEMFSGLIMPPS